MIRHCLYFVYPWSGKGIWERNVAQLLERAALFDGKRVAAVATHDGPLEATYGRGLHTLDSPDEVRALMEPAGFEIIEVGASSLWGEAVAFRPLWYSVRQFDGPDDVTFYAHTKGVSYPPDHPSVHAWTSILYSANLDFWPLVEKEFRRGKHAVGSMRQHTGDPKSRFIFSGAFYWLRNRAVFSKKWWYRCRPRWAAVELWPGQIFTVNESSSLFKAYPPGLQAYDGPWMDETVAEFSQWAAERESLRTQLLTSLQQ